MEGDAGDRRGSGHICGAGAGLPSIRHKSSQRPAFRPARRILEDVSKAENAIGGLIGHPQGDLQVSVPFTFAVGPLARMMPGFMPRYPDVRVLLTIQNRVVDMLGEEFDLVIPIGPLVDSELIARRLATMALWPCASPAYLASHAPVVEPTDLKAHTIVGHGGTREMWSFERAPDPSIEIELEPSAVAPEPDVVRTMLIAGAGIGILPDFHASDLIAAGILVRVLLDYQHCRVDVHALYTSHRSLSAKVRVLINALIAAFPRTAGPSS